MRRGRFLAADADMEFKNKYTEAKRLIKKLEKSLDRFAQKQKQEKNDWGYVGSMGKTVEDLKSIISFIGE